MTAVDQSSLVGAIGLPLFLQGSLERIPIFPVADGARHPPRVNQNLRSSQSYTLSLERRRGNIEVRSTRKGEKARLRD